MTQRVPNRPPGPGHLLERVLVVDHDAARGECLTSGLRRCRYEAECVRTGHEALARHANADLIVLEVELPDMDGVEVCEEIREVSDVPIIAFTARKAELDRVLVLLAGADDCMTTPCGFRELLARIEAVARRSGPPARGAPPISLEALRIDTDAREVFKDGVPVRLTRKEFDLFCLFASQPDAVFSRRQLMMEVWGRPSTESGRTRTLDTHINSLRQKLGSSTWIVTVRGVGFRLGRG
ncbi:response regulator transcription factor [Amycolatopsis pithecellobii]|uniref:response regulator transcription factor n=1 Tax=Amycolatopsis pithecellobii TaxID=664692 RepID=UPI001AA01FA6|nr:response regulator transcription factor [Amycolatopsis pithecellobii]